MTTPETRQQRRRRERQEKRQESRKPPTKVQLRLAFRRVKEQFAALEAVVKSCEPFLGQPVSYAAMLRAGLMAVPPYKSRGKGQGGRLHYRSVAQVKRQAAKRRNVLRERARRKG